ncbi:MAG: hypothetical protein KAH16_03630 [Candidatus Izimaplasma sp.]|nr:hypothetical protein [Candidatus Izimaplasma bacterium]
MKNTSRIYLFVTSLFFMFSPFSFGIVVIYFEDSTLLEYSSGLIVNAVLLLILFAVLSLLITKKKLSIPNLYEKKLLIFGLLSNIVIYFYTFQNSLEIMKYITIYSTIILILILYLFIIDRNKLNYELWILAILFIVVDFIHFSYIFTEHNGGAHFPNNVEATFIQRIFYFSIPLATLSLFIRKIKEYKLMDSFTYTFVGLTVLICLIFFNGIDVEDKLILTFNLIIPFVILIELIVSVIYKRFNIYKIIFYLRMGTIIILIYIYYGIDYFTMDSYSDHNLIELVMITYVVIICNLIEYLSSTKETTIKKAITS